MVYTGGINEKQRHWLEKDLSYIPDSMQVVVMAHIPFLQEYFKLTDLEWLIKTLSSRQNVLCLFGHLHQMMNFDFTTDMGWTGKGKMQGIVAGAACGSWWTGPKDERGIPSATCMDGSPNGFFQFQFSDQTYYYSFVPASLPANYQMRISYPVEAVLASELADKQLIVNFFTGNKNDKINLRIDEGEFIEMTFAPDIDPFMEERRTLHKSDGGWLPSLDICFHLWKAPFPTNLSKGLHKVQVVAETSNGKQYRLEQVFEVK
jgi:hypothetical protein